MELTKETCRQTAEELLHFLEEKPQQLSRYCQYNEYAGSSRL